MMFRPVRTLILIAIAFGAGVMWERERAAENCVEKAGVLQDIVCR